MSHSDTAIEMDEAEARRIAEKDAWDYIEQGWASELIAKWKARLERAGFPDVEIAFSGFCSQGDGASFTCGSRPWPMSKEDREAIEKAITFDKAVDRLRGELREEYLTVDRINDECQFRIIRDRGFHYVHECSTSIEWNDWPGWNDGPDGPRTSKAIQAWLEGQEEFMKEWMRKINRGIYRQLNRWHDLEYEHTVEWRTEQILNGEE